MKNLITITTAVILALGAMNTIFKTNTQAPYSPEVMEAFAQWQVTHNQLYATPSELSFRFEQFSKSYAKVKEVNAQNRSYRLGLNKFSAMTEQELETKYLGYVEGSMTRNAPLATPEQLNQDPPASLDWREKGAVTGVKDQASCGSCWAFSTTGAMEAGHFFAGNDLMTFSEQQLMDCSKSYGNKGCRGGFMDWAYNYVKDFGAMSEDDYPYEMKDTLPCRYDSAKDKGHLKSYVKLNRDEADFLKGVAQSPVAFGANATPWFRYSGGVYDNLTECPARGLNHAILAVGYGTDAVSGNDYWIVKNSWGASWGENGYMRLLRQASGFGVCGLALDGSIVTMDKM
jgi:C1A family cysteine protease